MTLSSAATAQLKRHAKRLREEEKQEAQEDLRLTELSLLYLSDQAGPGLSIKSQYNK